MDVKAEKTDIPDPLPDGARRLISGVISFINNKDKEIRQNGDAPVARPQKSDSKGEN